MSAKRVFVDTNVILRYLTNDVPEQANTVEALLRRATAGELTLVTNALIVAEIVWTLQSFYRLEREQIQTAVLAILNTPGLEIVDGDLILKATIWHAERNVDWIDAYSAAWMVSQSIDTAYTFDRKHFARLPGIRALVPGKM